MDVLEVDLPDVGHVLVDGEFAVEFHLGEGAQGVVADEGLDVAGGLQFQLGLPEVCGELALRMEQELSAPIIFHEVLLHHGGIDQQCVRYGQVYAALEARLAEGAGDDVQLERVHGIAPSVQVPLVRPDEVGHLDAGREAVIVIDHVVHLRGDAPCMVESFDVFGEPNHGALQVDAFPQRPHGVVYGVQHLVIMCDLRVVLGELDAWWIGVAGLVIPSLLHVEAPALGAFQVEGFVEVDACEETMAPSPGHEGTDDLGGAVITVGQVLQQVFLAEAHLARDA